VSTADWVLIDTLQRSRGFSGDEPRGVAPGWYESGLWPASRPACLVRGWFWSKAIIAVDHVPATIKSENPSVKCGLSTLSRSKPPPPGGESPPASRRRIPAFSNILRASRGPVVPLSRGPAAFLVMGRWDAPGTDGGTDAKSKSAVFTGLGTMGRLYTPKTPVAVRQDPRSTITPFCSTLELSQIKPQTPMQWKAAVSCGKLR
jgi:hypothetical protein